MRLAFWRPLSEERRQALERWACLRLDLVADDPMIAIIGALARLRDEGWI
jgi:hypothetical protein